MRYLILEYVEMKRLNPTFFPFAILFRKTLNKDQKALITMMMMMIRA